MSKVDAIEAELFWRLNIVLAERHVRTTRELRRRLDAVGYKISEPQLSRIRRLLPRQLDTRLLWALCRALETTPGDLLSLHSRPTAAAAPPPATGATQQASAATRNTKVRAAKTFKLAGPRIRAMPAVKD
jgi:DNA-binding Xre family transcriptional regulator